jgi:hypothetical protein
VQTPDDIGPRPRRRLDPVGHHGDGIWAIGHTMTWVAGLVLALSAFMGWYAGSSLEGPTIAVIGWHTGTLGKLVFFIGLVVVALAILREAGIELPAAAHESLVAIALGSLATIFVLIRLISKPDTFFELAGRGIGIWIALFAAIGVIIGGILQAGEEL